MTPTIDQSLHRIRSYFGDEVEMTVHQVAVAAGVHWTAAARVLRPGGEPSFTVAKKIEALVPEDFIGPPLLRPSPDATPPAPCPASGGQSMDSEERSVRQSASGMPQVCLREREPSCSIVARGADR